MGCDACSWLRPRVPITLATPTLGQPLPKPIFSSSSFPSSFKRATAISCSMAGPTNSSSSSSSTRSYSRRWYNPIRRQPPSSYDTSSEILRHWVEVQQPLASQDRFTVASYNILGERNASKHKDLYINVPSDYLRWAYRKRVLCEELMGWNPDIICMQEVDKYFDLRNTMEKAGYVGSYKRRTGGNVDGCATFWKPDKFRLLEREGIEFKGFGLRDNVAQLSVFEICRVESRRLVVGNIHVLYNPSRGEVKLGQIRFLSTRAQMLSNRWGNVPVVLGGDFNSTPQLDIKLYNRKELSGQRSCHPSQVLGLNRESRSPFTIMDGFFNDCWTDKEVRVATGSADSHLVEHPLKLSSSYATVKGSTNTRDLNGEPLATSYHSKFLGTVDYLWYSEGILPTRVLDTLPIDILRRTGGLPCKKLGSDHLALVTEFAFSKSAKDTILTMSAVSDGAISA
ncbi:carbon catabolite repressor protein 4 homolog 3 isoform X2 [Herrania umbratica]|uniref:Carbon catabolite repressor protein 4 homolog 3 isoform X2 n=1 Tax=Herrania umbratica TaxID=108875 RepID=A0A6J1AYU6_9ROSI|nr:carbon catabolite repressor protein 4 homolog 3 isoform X2 [Herrania umbratica]